MLKKIQSLPNEPGVYQFFDKNGKLLYVGKAKSLKNRVKSYFSFTPTLSPSPRLSARIYNMVTQAKSLDYIVVKSEHDALILENSLIKQLKPKYNILLRDDKTYPYIYIDLNEEFPRFEITRHIQKGSHIKYFGPFTTAARDILNAIYELNPLVQKRGSLKGKKACLFYQIGRCLAPCEGKISKDEYKKIVQNSLLLLKNKNLIVEQLKKKMQFYAKNELFEEAAKARDALQRIKNSTVFSQIDMKNSEHLDLFYILVKDMKAVIVKIFVRDGKIVSIVSNILKNDSGFSKDEIYKSAILEFYKDDKPIIANSIIVGEEFDEIKLLEELINQKSKKKIHIILPKRGAKKELLKIAHQNAVQSLTEKKDNTSFKKLLKEKLKLSKTPYTIEAYDNSHLQGSSPVGSMIFYENGFLKSGYRHYNLSSKDEYAQMRELLTKRSESFEKNPPPDLWVIDGGETLLKLAKDICESFGVDIDLVAISKEKSGKRTVRNKGKAKDKIYGINGEIALKDDDECKLFIQKLRDEAHRFAIKFHRSQKLKQDKKISLLEKKGIGKAKVAKLLNYFGTFEAIEKASKEEIEKVIGKLSDNF
jgi:excinuclease ABC subunit C